MNKSSTFFHNNNNPRSKLRGFQKVLDKILSVYKPVAVTPLLLIEDLRKKFPEFQNEKIGYAGRLDPMAHGVMLLMIGDATKQRDQLQGLKKTYEFSVLFGVETDTYDVMGVLKSTQIMKTPDDLEKQIKAYVSRMVGLHTQHYPPFSSFNVNGKALYWYAKNNLLHTINIPSKEIEIYKLELVKTSRIEAKKVQKNIVERVSKTIGDFRQGEIIDRWNEFFAQYPSSLFTLSHFRIECSSGTYVRSIVYELGQKLRCGAIAYEILRTHVGEYNINNSLKVS